jgi:HNH endonuclease
MGALIRLEPEERFGRWVVLKQGPTRRNGATWLCRCDCGATRYVIGKFLRSGHSRSCGCLARELTRARIGPKHPRWKGRLNDRGYRLVRRGDKTVLLHRIVMERKLGRPLLLGESVHHLNGNRSDNRPENLELWVSAQPFGQRVSDRVRDAIEILQRYAPERLEARG